MLEAKERVAVPPPPLQIASSGTFLPMPFVQQPRSNLCWAACAEMVFLMNNRKDISICAMASCLTSESCCVEPMPDACNAPQWPDDLYAAYKYHSDWSDGAFKQDLLLQELKYGRPVQAHIVWNDESSHTVLIAGMYFDNGDLLVYDPLGTGPFRNSYKYVSSGFNIGIWNDSWNNIYPLGDNDAKVSKTV